MRIQQ